MLRARSSSRLARSRSSRRASRSTLVSRRGSAVGPSRSAPPCPWPRSRSWVERSGLAARPAPARPPSGSGPPSGGCGDVGRWRGDGGGWRWPARGGGGGGERCSFVAEFPMAGARLLLNGRRRGCGSCWWAAIPRVDVRRAVDGVATRRRDPRLVRRAKKGRDGAHRLGSRRRMATMATEHGGDGAVYAQAALHGSFCARRRAAIQAGGDPGRRPCAARPMGSTAARAGHPMPFHVTRAHRRHARPSGSEMLARAGT
jgi:hypothetical protein